MKQIGNWVFGSFFRTIGRLLVFVLLGFIIAHFVDFGSLIDNFRITDLFFEKVNASTWDSQWISGAQISTDWGQNYSTMYEVENYYTYNNNVQQSGTSLYWMKFNNGPFTISQDTENIYATIRFKVSTNEQITTSGIEQQYTCNTNANFDWGNDFEGDMGDDVEIWYNSFTCVTHGYNESSTVVKPEFSLHLDYFTTSESALPPCLPQSNNGYEYTFKCPILPNSNQIKGFRLAVNTKNTINYDIGLYFSYLYDKDKTQQIIDSQNQNTQAITNQTQQDQQQHEELMDTNMTETNETASGFFDSFESDDIGGLSGIVTAPLNMINKMLDGTCTSPSATWKGATISLPCGSMFWNRPGAGDIKNLLNIFYGGFLCYYAIRKLFLMVEGMKDPTNDRIEVSDL